MEKTGAAPTGCYKCGRPGHWSRDCPSSAPNSNSNPNLNPNPKPNPKLNPNTNSKPGGGVSEPAEASSVKPKKVPKKRPKLTPELLLSNDGLGYVLRHFPRAFKYRGRGHEVDDLGHLIGLYAEWHSRLLPYYSFDQFVQKVEQVGTTKRVKMCIRDLRERVANGGDPTKLHELPIENDGMNDKQGPKDPMNMEEPSHNQGDSSSKNDDFDDMLMQENVFHEIYNNATQGPSETLHSEMTSEITEEQKARMEANRLKALNKAAALAHSSKNDDGGGDIEEMVHDGDDDIEEDMLNEIYDNDIEEDMLNEIYDNATQEVPEILREETASAKQVGETEITEEQKAGMEANRLKALERAAARGRSLATA